jgi:HEAT repeat protein
MKRTPLITSLVITAGLFGVATLCTQEPAQESLKERVDHAVAEGVKALKNLQTANGTWKYSPKEDDKDIGCTALCGLALLEGGVPASDPSVTRAANYVRAAAPSLQQIYAMSLVIMFLDRYGGAAEDKTVNGLARRLMRGQVDGGWSYTYNETGGSSPRTPGAISVIGGAAPPAFGGTMVVPDNSNTQFAILALWIARKHGADVEAALLAADQRFRSMQAKDGGWGYGATPAAADKSTPAMTCAGLLGLGVGHGAAKMKEARLRAVGKGGAAPAAPRAPPPEVKGGPDIAEDAAVQAALGFLAKHVGSEVAEVSEWLYFLWSLERVCVAYKFKTIGKVDWYDWGARKLLKEQDGDGSWTSKYGAAVDTSWAILFLRKADLVGNIRTAEIRAGKGDEGVIQEPPAATKKREPTKTADAKPPAAPPANDTTEVDASKLASALVYARGDKQDELIAEYQKKPGVTHTLALAAAVKDLPEEAQVKARLALATRLQRFTLSTLTRYLADEDRELRLAAATAMGQKRNKDAVPLLIQALKDRDSAVVTVAHLSLKSLTGQKFDKHPEPWEAWWKANGGEPESK